MSQLSPSEQVSSTLEKLIEIGETESKNPNNTMTQDYITGRFG